MGEFLLDFSAYNALLSGGNGYGGSYYGPDDVFLGGGDPGFSLLTNVGRRHFQHVHNQQQLHQQQQQLNRAQAPPGTHAATAAAAAGHHSHHRVNSRYLVNDRNSLARLEAEKTLQDRRKAHIANFGATWLKPPGVSKTLFQIREECREQEEQAEAERREELAQELVRAEAAAAMEAEEGAEPGWAEGEEGEGGEGEEGDGVAGETAGQDEMEAGEEELDLDNEIPDAEDFSFGNNDDGSDDPFASSEEGEDDEESGEDGGEDDEDDRDLDNDADQDDQIDDTFDQGRPHELMRPDEQAAYTPLPPGASSSGGGRRRYRESGEGSRPPDMSPFAGLSGAAAAFVTPVHAAPVLSVEDRREQVRARAAERRETHQIRATEDRVRAMLTQPRLAGLGGLAGGMSGLYGDDDDLDEDDQAQMLQEDDLVRGSIGRPAGRGGSGANGSRRRLNRSMGRDSLGNGGAGNAAAAAGMGDSSAVDDDEEGGNYYTSSGDYHQDESGLEMDMDADLDEGVPEGSSPAAAAMDMDISAYDDGTYEHTDTEAELSSSVFDGGDPSSHAAQPARSRYQRERSGLDVEDGDDDYDADDMDFDVNGGGGAGAGAGGNNHGGGARRRQELYPDGGDDLPHHSFRASGLDASGSLMGHSRAAPRTTSYGGMAGGSDSTRARPGRRSLGRSDRNSLDISGLLSRDGSSNVGSSPGQVRWQQH